MAYFDELLQRAITVRNNRAPASNTADLVGGVLVAIVTALQMLLDDKQDSLTFDTTPTADSPNPVTSDGIHQALQAIDLSACEKIVNKVTSINAQSTDVQYPSAKLLYDSLQALSQVYAAIQHTHAIADIINLQTELNARQLVSNLVTAITAQSTDAQYPSAKLLFDQLALKANQSTTYTKTEVDALIGALSTVSFAVVQQLPTSDIQTNVIYLVPASQPGQSNIYNEYIYVNNNWELIGSTAIDLSGYEQTANKVTTISAQSTDVQYPSAKCVYDELQNLYNLIYYYHAPTYYVRGTSSNVNGTEIFKISYRDDITGNVETIIETVNVDANGDWYFSYRRKRVYSLAGFARESATLLTVDFTDADDFAIVTAAGGTSTSEGAFYNCTSLVSVNLSNATFAAVTTAQYMFLYCANLTSVNMSAATFAACGSIRSMFNGCANLTALNLSAATFAVCISANALFLDCLKLPAVNLRNATFASVTAVTQMFENCEELTTIDLSAATFASLVNAVGMFKNCPNLYAIDLSAATFAELVTAGTSIWTNGMFSNLTALTSIALPSADFPKLKVASNWFYGCTALQTVTFKQGVTFAALESIDLAFDACTNLTTINNLDSATFERVTQMKGFARASGLTALNIPAATFAAMTNTSAGIGSSTNGIFYGAQHLVSIVMSAATFENITKNIDTFAQCYALTTIDVPQNSTAIAAGATPANTPMNFAACPLTYTSMYKVANWLRDFTGGSAHTVTFKTSAWNALTTAEQTTIDNILSGKNWTRVLA